MFKDRIPNLKSLFLTSGILSIVFSMLIIFTSAANGLMIEGGAGVTCSDGSQIYCYGYTCSTTATSCKCKDRRGAVESQQQCPNT